MERADVFPLGIGTYGLGAPRVETPDLTSSAPTSPGHREALRRAHSLGMNFVEASFVYAGGATMRFLGDFIKTVPRESLFVTVKLEHPIRDARDVSRQIDTYLHELSIDYADALLLHKPSSTMLSLLDTYGLLAEEVRAGKARHLSASNLGPADLRELCLHHRLFSFEGLYNLECKMYEDEGTLDLCASQGILFAAYKPLRLNRIAQRGHPLLVELSRRYACTQNQILLNWLVRRKGVMPLVKAASVAHVEENVAALAVTVEPADLDRLDAFRSPEFDEIEIDWSDSGGLPIYRVASSVQ